MPQWFRQILCGTETSKKYWFLKLQAGLFEFYFNQIFF